MTMYQLSQDIVNPHADKRHKKDIGKIAKLPYGTEINKHTRYLDIDVKGETVRREIVEFSTPGLFGTVRADSEWGKVIETALGDPCPITVRAAVDILGWAPEAVLEYLERAGKITGDDVLLLDSTD